MNKFKTLCLAVVAMVLTGCGTTPTPQTPLAANFYVEPQSKELKVGIFLSTPSVDTSLPGAGCLLCMAAASVANSSLTKHMKTLSKEELQNLDDNLLAKLNEKGMAVEIVKSMPSLKSLPKFRNKSPMFSEVDFRSLKSTLGLDKLIVIEVDRLGAYRPYSGYIPSSDPMGTVAGVTYMVDLATNHYDMYMPVEVNVAVTGEWDEPPRFPGVTNSYYQAIEMAKEKVLQMF